MNGLDCGRLVVNDLDLLVVILRRGDDQVRGFVVENDLGVFNIFVPLTPDHANGDNGHDPDHPQENTEATSCDTNAI